MRSSTFE